MGEMFLDPRCDLLPDVCLATRALDHRVTALNEYSDRNVRQCYCWNSWAIVTTGCQLRTASLLVLHSRISAAFDSQLHSVTVFTRIQCRPCEEQPLRTWCFQTRQADKSGTFRMCQTSELAPTSRVEWNMSESEMFFLTCCDRTIDFIFIPSQSRNWQLVLLKWKTPETRQVLSERTPWCALPLWCRGRMDGHEALLEMRLGWSLDRTVTTSMTMTVRKFPCLSSSFCRKHARRRSNHQTLVRNFSTSMRTSMYTSRQRYLPRVNIELFHVISKLRPVSQFCVCDQANCRHSAHVCKLKYVKMPISFRASKLLPVALHFACKVRYVSLLRP